MKNNRGSLTMTAFFTMLIFSSYGILLYARSASAYNRQTKSIEKIQAIYAQDVPDALRMADQLGANQNITVTFDANGGIVDTTNKQIAYGETYGELPVPRREGYTFKGWNNQKNLLNINTTESYPSSTTNANSTQRIFAPNTYVVGLAYNNYYGRYSLIKNSLSMTNDRISFVTSSGYGIGFPVLSSENKTYTFSFDIISEGNGFASVMYYQEDGTFISYLLSDDGNITFTPPPHTYYFVLCIVSNGINVNVNARNLQLEEGTEATEYEPYYITASTKVVQQNNHTLTAIWEKN